MGPRITIAGRHIGEGERPFVIAELSGNHNGSLDRALEIVDLAAAAGADALKLQTYTADTLTIDVDAPAFRIRDAHGLWGGRALHDLYHEAHTPWEWHEPLFRRAVGHGMVAFSSPFDETAVAFLEELGCPAYKVASAELVDPGLIAMMADTGKPLIMSTGMATLAEIDQAVTAARAAGCKELALLACTSAYPAQASDARLGNMRVLERAFGAVVGLSDHTIGLGVAAAAVALGAKMIEKHITADSSAGGVDDAFSLDGSGFAMLVKECTAAWEAAGSTSFGPQPDELDVLGLRRSLFVVEDVQVGDAVTRDNVRSIRPSGGLPPGALPQVLGRPFAVAATRGTPLSWDLL